MEAPRPPKSFKIVKTAEGTGKSKSLAVIPAEWEKEGVLYWPKMNSQAKTIKYIKCHMLPGTAAANDTVKWINCPTKVLEDNIATYEAAGERMKLLLRADDSSASSSENENVILQHRRVRTSRETTSTSKNYSDLLHDVVTHVSIKIYVLIQYLHELILIRVNSLFILFTALEYDCRRVSNK